MATEMTVIIPSPASRVPEPTWSQLGAILEPTSKHQHQSTNATSSLVRKNMHACTAATATATATAAAATAMHIYARFFGAHL